MDNTLNSHADLGFLGFWAWDAISDRVEASPEVNRYFRVNDLDENGRAQMCDYELRVHPADIEWLRKARALSAGPSGHGVVEYRVIDGRGATHWIMCRAIYVFNTDGSIERAHGILFDVTPFKMDGNAPRTAPVPFSRPLHFIVDSCLEAYRAAQQMGNAELVRHLAEVLKISARLLSQEIILGNTSEQVKHS